jgi:hypothetical protein
VRGDLGEMKLHGTGNGASAGFRETRSEFRRASAPSKRALTWALNGIFWCA